MPDPGDTVELDSAELHRSLHEALREARAADLRRVACERARAQMGHDLDDGEVARARPDAGQR